MGFGSALLCEVCVLPARPSSHTQTQSSHRVAATACNTGVMSVSHTQKHVRFQQTSHNRR